MKKGFLILLLFIAASHVYAVKNETNTTAQVEAPGTEEQNASASSPESKPSNETTQASQKQNSREQKTVDLETAYKREYAFLEAQKRELNERLKRFKSSAHQEEQKLSQNVNSLERNSVDRSAKIDLLNSQLIEAERQEAAIDERNDTLEITYSQASATLENHDVKIPPTFTDTQSKDPAKVSYLFKQALTLINELGAIKTKPGEFFLEDGKQTEGNIIHLGNIAAYGVSTEGSGSLVPAGEGNFKIWNVPTADIATALSNNQQPDNLKLFLFESRTTAIEENPEKSLMEVIESGGVIGWIIVALGAFAALLILVRAYLLYSNSMNTKQLSRNVMQQVANGRLDKAKENCGAGSSAIARVLSTTLSHLKDDREHMDSVVHESILQESSALDRFGSAILVIASVSPLLGLLGTVTGMISTFDVITEFGTGDPKLLSGGISIALVTTKLGLTVAIPALMLGSLLSAWARNIKRDMEHAALSVTNAFFDGSNPNDSDESPVNDNTLVLNN
jgi:biopolymer transport protein ExbB